MSVKKMLMVLAVVLLLGSVSFAQFQQPTPGEEEVGPKPTPSYPEPRSSALRAVDLAVFVSMLAVSALCIIKFQSRRAIMLLALTSILYFGLWRNGCVCPIGSIQNVAMSLSDSGYTISIFITVIFLLPIFFALLFGRVFCGALCPLGALQAWLNPTRFFIRVPEKLDRVLGKFRWLYLLAAIYLAIGGIAVFALDMKTAPRFIICATDPFVNIFRTVNLRSLSGGSGELFLKIAPAGMWYLTAAMVLLSVIFIRPYCRWFCPYGVLLGACSRAARWPVSLKPRACTECASCDAACPVNAIHLGKIDAANCVACGRCHSACPVERFDKGRKLLPALIELPPRPAHKKVKQTRTAINAANIEPMDEKLDLSYLPQVIEHAKEEKSGALKILMAIQNTHGYLAKSAIAEAANLSEFSEAELISTSSFYNLFRYEPVGEHLVSVCHGTACHVAGAPAVTAALRRHLNIAEGRDTDSSKQFTVEKIACLGCCSLAPVMQVDGVTYGHLTGERACEIIEEISSGSVPKGGDTKDSSDQKDCCCEDSHKGGCS